MSTPRLEVQERKKLGKNTSRRSRREGLIPAVMYGNINKHYVIDVSKIDELLRNYGKSVVFEIDEGGNIYSVLFKEIQTHPVNGTLIHVDVMKIDMNEIISSKVPIVYTKSNTIKASGSIIESQKDYLQVRGRVKDIPKQIDVDLSKYINNQVLKVKDLEISSEISINENFENIIASFTRSKPLD